MQVDRSELLKVLDQLKPGIATKEFVEQSAHFIFNVEEIVSYSGYISVACPFDIGIECTVHSSIFYKLLSKMKKETVTLELEGTTLKVECGSVNAELPTVIASEIFEHISKLSEEQNDLKWNPLPEDFLDAVELCSFCASTDSTTGIATCVWVEGEDVLATDKYRASWFKMEDKVKKNFYVEANYISELLKYAVPVEFCISESWVHFQLADNTVFSTRLEQPDDEKLNIKEKFEQFKCSIEVPLPDDLHDAIETVSIAVNNEEKLDQLVKVEFGKEMIRCIGTSHSGTIKKDLHLEDPMDIEPFSIEASPFSLLDVIENATHLAVGEKAGVFKSTELTGFQHIIGILKDD